MAARSFSVRVSALAMVLLVLAACTSAAAPRRPAPSAPEAAPASAPAPVVDGQASDFYRGKTVRIVVGADAGGGMDLYTRLIARHIGRQIPGNPTVVVENIRVLAGSSRLATCTTPRRRMGRSSPTSSAASSARSFSARATSSSTPRASATWEPEQREHSAGRHQGGGRHARGGAARAGRQTGRARRRRRGDHEPQCVDPHPRGAICQREDGQWLQLGR